MADTTVHANGGHIIKHFRKKAKITQKQLAEKLFMSHAMLSKVENGEHDIEFLGFKSALAICGVDTDDYWVVTLTADEFEGFLLYKKMGELYEKGHKFHDEKSQMYYQLMISPLAKHTFVQQFLSCIQVHKDDALLTDEQKLNILYTSLYKSLKNFSTENAHMFRFAYEEILLVYEIARIYGEMGDDGHSIILLKSITGNEEKLKITAAERFRIIPLIYAELIKIYVTQQNYTEALTVLEKLPKLLSSFGISPIGPIAAYYKGVCYHKTQQDEKTYMPLINMAYHAAKALRQMDLVAKIEEEYDVS